MTDIQRDVQDAVDRLVASGAERGLQVHVRVHGEPVVDAVAGVADPASRREMTPATPVYGWSMGKALTATIVHILAERRLFGYDTPVAELWPEFAARGKGGVTLRHVLNHTAGVPGLPPGTTVEDVCDWDAICAGIADLEPWWEPGKEIGYHAYTFGHILGEVVRRATGKPISRVLREEITEPLDLDGELYFGMPESEQHRLAVLEDAVPPEQAAAAMADLPPDLPMFRAAPMELYPTAALGNRADVLAADIPAGGKMSARAMARVYAALLAGELVPLERVREATADPVSGTDQVFSVPSTLGLGYSIGFPGVEELAGSFGFGGAGGSYACADPGTGLAFAFTKNRLTDGFDAAVEIGGIVARHLAV
ncbi:MULTISPECIES: serine hydrolase domain-containing protein [Actinomadura]|uniref:Serine hydrolase domain-containing protein n=1 Tax=Actinomadura yumaensis TaxID=111807 RepID=A0ABW2CQ07_9ACTN|nr:serine hydrolase domain-containing protein [Actinomadura sp. J1-007]MWK40457.1 serine hydrolase [Actinomadura sp. J1-007]